MTNLTKDSTKNEILEALSEMEELEIEDEVPYENLNISMTKYKGIDGYFYDDNYNQYWINDPYDFEIDEEGNTSLPNAIWLKNI